jgi:hypothetical protein
MLRIPHWLDNRFTDGGEVDSLTNRPRSTSQKHFFISLSGIHYCYRLSKSKGLVWPEGLEELTKLNDNIELRTHDLPAEPLNH